MVHTLFAEHKRAELGVGGQISSLSAHNLPSLRVWCAMPGIWEALGR